MTILNEKYTLNNGIEIPKLGFGTWLIDNDKAATAVQQAAKLGYRHFDTAQAYGNEEGVGAGLKASGLNRDEVFVTTKVQAEFKDYDSVKNSIDESLQKLGLDYVDLLLIHAPEPWAEFHGAKHYFKENLEVWRAMEEAVQAGKAQAIGVSNFQQEDLTNILENGSIRPAVNQLLTHIGNTSFDLLEQGKQNDVLVEAYSPVAHGEILQNEQIKQMAAKYQVSVPQLAIRYCLELGTLPLPKSETPEHIADNAAIDFKIDAADMEILKNLPQFKDYGDSSAFPVFSGK